MKNGMAELITSKRTKKILTGKLTAIEGILDKDTKTIKDHGVVFYEGYKVIIPADEMNLYNVSSSNNQEAVASDSNAKITYDFRRTVLRGLIGAEIDFIVKDIDQEKEIATASRREGMQLRKILEFGKHNVGDRILVRVVGVGRSQVIVEAYGVQAVVPINEVAWGRIYDIRDYASVGDKTEAIITEINEDSIKVSLREAKKEPYQDLIIDKGYYRQYGEYEGTIKAIKDFGVFVELAPGITVLCNYPNWIGFSPELGKKLSIQIKRFKNAKRYIDGTIIREL